MTPVDTIDSVLKIKGTQIWSIEPTATVFEAIEHMSNLSIGALLVMSGESLVGIVSERDYARKVILRDRSSKTTEVREIMTSPAITVTRNNTVEHCMRIMTENRIRHLPVVERDRVLGMISIGDLVNWIITSHEETIGQLQNYIEGRYPA